MTASTSLKSAVAGVAGACALTLLHQNLASSSPRAPRLDKLGIEAARKSLRAAGQPIPDSLYEITLAGDLIANSLYYGFVAAFGPKRAIFAGAVLGAAGGIGAVVLPRRLGLDNSRTDRTGATQAMTIGLYTTAGLVAGAVYRLLS